MSKSVFSNPSLLSVAFTEVTGSSLASGVRVLGSTPATLNSNTSSTTMNVYINAVSNLAPQSSNTGIQFTEPTNKIKFIEPTTVQVRIPAIDYTNQQQTFVSYNPPSEPYPGQFLKKPTARLDDAKKKKNKNKDIETFTNPSSEIISKNDPFSLPNFSPSLPQSNLPILGLNTAANLEKPKWGNKNGKPKSKNLTVHERQKKSKRFGENSPEVIEKSKLEQIRSEMLHAEPQLLDTKTEDINPQNLKWQAEELTDKTSKKPQNINEFLQTSAETKHSAEQKLNENSVLLTNFAKENVDQQFVKTISEPVSEVEVSVELEHSSIIPAKDVSVQPLENSQIQSTAKVSSELETAKKSSPEKDIDIRNYIQPKAQKPAEVLPELEKAKKSPPEKDIDIRNYIQPKAQKPAEVLPELEKAKKSPPLESIQELPSKTTANPLRIFTPSSPPQKSSETPFQKQHAGAEKSRKVLPELEKAEKSLSVASHFQSVPASSLVVKDSPNSQQLEAVSPNLSDDITFKGTVSSPNSGRQADFSKTPEEEEREEDDNYNYKKGTKNKGEEKTTEKSSMTNMNNGKSILDSVLDPLFKEHRVLVQYHSTKHKVGDKKIPEKLDTVSSEQIKPITTSELTTSLSESPGLLARTFKAVGKMFKGLTAPPEELTYGKFGNFHQYNDLFEEKQQILSVEISDEKYSRTLESVKKLLDNTCFRTDSSLTIEEEKLKKENLKKLKSLALDNQGKIKKYLPFLFLIRYEFQHISMETTKYNRNLEKFAEIKDFGDKKYTDQELLIIAQTLIDCAKIKEITIQAKLSALNKARSILSHKKISTFAEAVTLLEKVNNIADDLKNQENSSKVFDLTDKNLLKGKGIDFLKESASIYETFSEVFSEDKDENRSPSSRKISTLLKNCGDNETKKEVIYNNLLGLFKNLKINFNDASEEIKQDLANINRNIQLVPLEIIFGPGFNTNPLIKYLLSVDNGKEFLSSVDLEGARKLKASQDNYQLIHGSEPDQEEDILREFFSELREEALKQDEKKSKDASEAIIAEKKLRNRDVVKFLKGETAGASIQAILSSIKENADKMAKGELVSPHLQFNNGQIVAAASTTIKVGVIGASVAVTAFSIYNPLVALGLAKRGLSSLFLYNTVSPLTFDPKNTLLSYGPGSFVNYFNPTFWLNSARNMLAVYGAVNLTKDASNTLYATVNAQQIQRMGKILGLLLENQETLIEILNKPENIANFGTLFEGETASANLQFFLKILILNIDYRLTSGTTLATFQRMLSGVIDFNNFTIDHVKESLEELFKEGIIIPEKNNYLNILSQGSNQVVFTKKIRGQPDIILTLGEIAETKKSLSEVVRDKFPSTTTDRSFEDETGIKALTNELYELKAKEKESKSNMEGYLNGRRAKTSSILGLIAAPALVAGSIIMKSSLGVFFWPVTAYLAGISLVSFTVFLSKKDLSIFSSGGINKEYKTAQNNVISKEEELKSEIDKDIKQAEIKRQEFLALPKKDLEISKTKEKTFTQVAHNPSFLEKLSNLPNKVLDSFVSGAKKIVNFLPKFANILGLKVKEFDIDVKVKEDGSSSTIGKSSFHRKFTKATEAKDKE